MSDGRLYLWLLSSTTTNQLLYSWAGSWEFLFNQRFPASRFPRDIAEDASPAKTELQTSGVNMNFVKFHEGEYFSRIAGAKIRQIDLVTPTFLPAFSSFGDRFIASRLEAVLPHIPQSVALISALDVHLLRNALVPDGRTVLQVLHASERTKLLYCDSGGYEAQYRKDVDWSTELYNSAVRDLQPDFAVAFDKIPGIGESQEISLQFDKALETLDAHRGLRGRVVLIHLPLKTHNRARELAEIAESRSSQFDILGVPEKEVGINVVDRCRFLIGMSSEFRRRGIDKPIHVFGCNDFDAILLYVASGAEIFDGLSWFRNCLSLSPTRMMEAGMLPLLACNCAFCLDANWGTVDPNEYGLRLSMHNLTKFSEWMGMIQSAIRTGNLSELLKQRKLQRLSCALFKKVDVKINQSGKGA